MEPLDQPIDLHFRNGKVFPSNVLILGYIFLGLSPLVFFGNMFLGAGLFLGGVFIAFTSNHVVVDLETQTIREYTAYWGFIRIGITTDYRKYGILTVVPVRQTTTTYARSIHSTSYTDYLFAVCLLGSNYRGKKELTKFPQKSLSENLAKELTHRMGMEYFDYDPMVIREKMLGR
ncbi:MAG: hypothetical protein K0S23_1347 [Fluviicola sp.]|jgi:prepilin signal peptidase PulO-like enzyme (type II secretory pathway)|uniref:hypothetical protein n=1 Tax=Fluviicola sp. TaxID=1917219 RepID=UPI002639FB90|nr:hypothetical protein [Fluviicola sp.]MDF3027040.1 hypothetical protein [Fluviicola sp.]